MFWVHESRYDPFHAPLTPFCFGRLPPRGLFFLTQSVRSPQLPTGVPPYKLFRPFPRSPFLSLPFGITLKWLPPFPLSLYHAHFICLSLRFFFPLLVLPAAPCAGGVPSTATANGYSPGQVRSRFPFGLFSSNALFLPHFRRELCFLPHVPLLSGPAGEGFPLFPFLDPFFPISVSR